MPPTSTISQYQSFAIDLPADRHSRRFRAAALRESHVHADAEAPVPRPAARPAGLFENKLRSVVLPDDIFVLKSLHDDVLGLIDHQLAGLLPNLLQLVVSSQESPQPGRLGLDEFGRPLDIAPPMPEGRLDLLVIKRTIRWIRSFAMRQRLDFRLPRLGKTGRRGVFLRRRAADLADAHRAEDSAEMERIKKGAVNRMLVFDAAPPDVRKTANEEPREGVAMKAWWNGL